MALPESISLETTRKSARLSSIIRHGFYVRTEINQHFPVSSVSSIRRPVYCTMGFDRKNRVTHRMIQYDDDLERVRLLFPSEFNSWGSIEGVTCRCAEKIIFTQCNWRLARSIVKYCNKDQSAEKRFARTRVYPHARYKIGSFRVCPVNETMITN